MTIWFDMDGTLADLYGVEGWLEMLGAEITTPYEDADPLIRFCTLAQYLNKLQKQGFEIGILSWLSKSGSNEYNEAVTEAKKAWLVKHLPSVVWDEIIIVPYGTPKQNFCRSSDDVLFDDEERNRACWNGRAYAETAIMEILKELHNNRKD